MIENADSRALSVMVGLGYTAIIMTASHCLCVPYYLQQILCKVLPIIQPIQVCYELLT